MACLTCETNTKHNDVFYRDELLWASLTAKYSINNKIQFDWKHTLMGTTKDMVWYLFCYPN